MRRKSFRKILVPLSVVAVVLTLFVPRAPRFSYEYKTGSVWRYPALVAEFDFPIYKTDSEILEESERLASKKIPLYEYHMDVSMRIVDAIRVADIRNEGKIFLMKSLQSIYEKGVLPDDPQHLSTGGSAKVETILLSRNKRAVEVPVKDIYTVGTAKMKLLSDVHKYFPDVHVDSLLEVKGIYNLIEPNLFFDDNAYSNMIKRCYQQVSPTKGYVSKGQVIVSEGDLITAETSRVLDSYKREFNANMGTTKSPLVSWIGAFLIAVALTVIFFFAVYFTNSSIFVEGGRFYYLLTIFLIASVLAMSAGAINPELLAILPFPVFAMYLRAFFRSRVILSVYSVAILPLLLIEGGYVYYLMFLFAGVGSIIMYKYFNRGWRQFITAGVNFLSLMFVFLAFYCLHMTEDNLLATILRLFLGSLLTVAAYPLIYIFERIFNLVSESRLQELCDTSKTLLRQLEQKAPGTFQHSLQVMNMADAVARAIGANDDLVRAGAMYHDIGKMANPACFIENESLADHVAKSSYHSDKSALRSAQDIIKHVSDGLALADKYHLPSVVKDFIRTHHGTSATAYFLGKYLEEGGDPANTFRFRYHGNRPSSTEQVIIMLCDSLEAAARTLKEYSTEAFDELVEKIIQSKIDDGQLDNAMVTLKEMCTMKSVLKNYLAQIYHERIVYPDKK